MILKKRNLFKTNQDSTLIDELKINYNYHCTYTNTQQYIFNKYK